MFAFPDNDQSDPNLACFQIAKPCGELLAEAMLLHMNKREWPELDTEEGYAKQVRESDQIGESQEGNVSKKNNSSYRVSHLAISKYLSAATPGD